MLEAEGVGGRNPSIFLPSSQQIDSWDWPLLGRGLANECRVVQARPGTSWLGLAPVSREDKRW